MEEEAERKKWKIARGVHEIHKTMGKGEGKMKQRIWCQELVTACVHAAAAVASCRAANLHRSMSKCTVLS